MSINEATATPEELRAAAAQKDRDAAESFERCDTDGFMSQWASGISAQKLRAEADLAESGGMWEFPALFDLAGNLVAAKLIDTRFGTAWALLPEDEGDGPFRGFVTAFPARPSTMARKGFYEGRVRAAAYVALVGNHAVNVRPATLRKDRGFSRDVVIVDNGQS